MYDDITYCQGAFFDMKENKGHKCGRRDKCARYVFKHMKTFATFFVDCPCFYNNEGTDYFMEIKDEKNKSK